MIVFSDHAKEQNKKRKIPEKWIIETVTSPEEVLESFRGWKLHRKRFSDKILEVVTITEGARITIITQYWLALEDK